MKLFQYLIPFVLSDDQWKLPADWSFCHAATDSPAAVGGGGGPGGPGGFGDRIVGGGPVDVGTWPFIVRLKFGRNYLCGGSLIDGKTVLTAAHCCHGQTARGFEVFINDHFTFQKDAQESKATVKEVDFPWVLLPQHRPVQLRSPNGSTHFKLAPVCQTELGWGYAAYHMHIICSLISALQLSSS